MFVFPGLVHGDAGGNVDRWCDWTVELECATGYKKKFALADRIFTISGLQVCNCLDMYWSWRHRYAVALVEMEEELSLGFKSNFHVRESS